jgi:hypothetical protein
MSDKSAAELRNGERLNMMASGPNSMPVSAVAAIIAAKGQ